MNKNYALLFAKLQKARNNVIDFNFENGFELRSPSGVKIYFLLTQFFLNMLVTIAINKPIGI